MFKVNNKNTRITSITRYTIALDASIVEFEKVNVTWVKTAETKTFDELFKSLTFRFLLSYHHVLLAHYLLKQIHHD